MKRLQRLRASKNIRDLCAQTEFTTAHFIQPLFVVEGLKADEEIRGLKGTFRNSIASLITQVASDIKAGVRHFILFPVPVEKGLKNLNHDFACSVIAEIKKKFGSEITLWVDTCLCSSTTHGHCCVFGGDGRQDLQTTLHEISMMARHYAEAGADGISPSDMNDGRVAEIRRVLDDVQNSKYAAVPIMSYSTKFASQFYGPFRNAADSAPQFGDRTQYQIDVRNRNDAVNSSLRCAEEGADLLMVKPAMTSLDLIQPISDVTGLPVGAYQVSGEYAAMVLLEKEGLLNFEKGLLESWHVLRRGGAQFIITYGARYASNLGVKLS